MFALPKSTEFGRRIPKSKFYEHLPVSPELKRMFIDQIVSITWQNKIAPDTVNISKGERVNEIEVIAIKLSGPTFDQKILRLIDKGIPYHLLYVMEYEGQIQLWISDKEQSDSKSSSFKIIQYYHTDWYTPEVVHLSIAGLNLDSVYDTLVKYIAGDALEAGRDDDIKSAIGRAQAIEKLEKLIAALENKRDKEKQLNRQVEINAIIKDLKHELEEMKQW